MKRSRPNCSSPGRCACLDDPVVADQQRHWVTGVDPLQPASGGVKAHHLRRDELLGSELVVDGLIQLPVQVREPGIGSPGMLVVADGESREHGGVPSVAHRVNDGQVQNVVVDRVVEAVASDVVGGLEDCCQRDPRDDHRPAGVPEAPSAERKTEPRDVDRTLAATRESQSPDSCK
jgi:hypothetical protein